MGAEHKSAPFFVKKRGIVFVFPIFHVFLQHTLQE